MTNKDHIASLEAKRAQAIEETEKRAQELVFLEWCKYRTDAATVSDGARRRAFTTIADSLQRLLEDWSPYGRKLVWDKQGR
jgi:hypothetical protein